ncbi:phage baseplate protein [Acinetobacter haemolyticus]|uniref:phage baseplate protein n=1 Tax=Acinetobacter haemolyticus TaxID=29430 RepID=UPI000F74278A|nr:hypothetical protein [Acinetobacter haemolyticus]RSN77884.1 hypothetical protein EA769_03435 [Acinetobacter haemolyticus]
MKRIDTVNARLDANGAGKAGFHDNADLSGQDATYIDPTWCNHVQEEIAAVVEGFGEALDPNQKDQVYKVVKGIADRTALIEDFIENIVDYFYPVGVVIDFGIPDFNPNVKYVGTTWVLHGEGKASVGLSIQEGDPSWTKTVGSTFGEYGHSLTTGELPNFRLESGVVMSSGTIDTGAAAFGTAPLLLPAANSIQVDGGACDVTALTSSIGNNQAHNIVQPSIVDARWRRIA